MSNPSSSEPIAIEASSPPEPSGNVFQLLDALLESIKLQTKTTKEVVEQAKTTNNFARQTNKRVVFMLVLLVFAFGISILQTVRMHQTVQRLEGTEVSLLEVKRELQESLVIAAEINKKATSTTQSVEKIQERVQDAPKLVADNKTGELKLEVAITKHQVNIAKTRATPKPPSPVPTTPDNGDEPPKAVIPIPGSSNLQF
jgi:hypothetical protein